MKSIALKQENEKHFQTRIDRFFKRYQIGEILRRSNGYKERGISVVELIRYLFCLVFRNRSMYQDMQTGKAPRFKKDTIYRLKNSVHMNWNRFTTLLSGRIIEETIQPLTSEHRRTAFIIDDSIFERSGAKNVELLAKVYDHARRRYTRGFRMLTLGWSDGVTMIPINACLLSTENAGNRLCESLAVNPKSNGAKAREMATKKATDVASELVSNAIDSGIQADYALFDSWFSSPKVIRSMKEKNLDVVAMVKRSSKIHYRFQEKMLSCKEIFCQCSHRRGRSRYLLSVPVEICGGDKDTAPLAAKLVFIRNRRDRNDYLVLLSTDTALSEDEIIQLYGKRWDIEVFFKTCKSVLKLTKECRSLSYDAMCAQVAIVLMRYMFLAEAIRLDKDIRSAGPLFCLVADELEDISFWVAFEKLQLFLMNLLNGFSVQQQDISALVLDFIKSLPLNVANFLNFSSLDRHSHA